MASRNSSNIIMCLLSCSQHVFVYNKNKGHSNTAPDFRILKQITNNVIAKEKKIIVRSFGSSKNTKLEDGPYCTISGNEPSSVTLYKTGRDNQTFCCNFKYLHLCSLNQRLKFPKGPYS